MSSLPAQLRAASWWLVPAALLVLVIGWQTDWGAAVRMPAPPAAPIEPKAVDSALLPEFVIAGGVAARPETVERTLFNPTRRPAPVSAQEGADARLKRGQFALAGTSMTSDGTGTAILREIAGNKSRRVKQGDSINGMLVAQVTSDRVRLAVGDESEELVLKVATNPRPTVPPTPSLAAPPAAVPVPAGVPQAAPVQRPVTAVPAQREAAAQTLAERRRAARAAQAAREANAAAGAAAPGAPAAGAADSGTAAGTSFDSVFQRYQQRSPANTRK